MPFWLVTSGRFPSGSFPAFCSLLDILFATIPATLAATGTTPKSMMGRGRHYSWWRKAGEAIEAQIYADGWAARGAFSLGLQGNLHIDRRDIYLPIRPHLTEPLRVAFASDLHAGPLTDPRLFDVLLVDHHSKFFENQVI